MDDFLFCFAHQSFSVLNKTPSDTLKVFFGKIILKNFQHPWKVCFLSIQYFFQKILVFFQKILFISVKYFNIWISKSFMWPGFFCSPIYKHYHKLDYIEHTKRFCGLQYVGSWTKFSLIELQRKLVNLTVLIKFDLPDI